MEAIIEMEKVETIDYLIEYGSEFTGPLYATSQFLILLDCVFSDNNGNYGGAIHIANNQADLNQQSLTIENLICKNNTGSQSGCIEFDKDLEYFSGFVNSSFFSENYAECTC